MPSKTIQMYIKKIQLFCFFMKTLKNNKLMFAKVLVESKKLKQNNVLALEWSVSKKRAYWKTNKLFENVILSGFEPETL